MATLVNTLYPPVMPTFSNAFVNTESAVVYFSLSQYNSASDIKRVHVSVVDQTNNENALSDACGVLFSSLKYDKDAGMYYVSIPASALAESEGENGFKINQFYKVQVRFDCYDVGGSADPSQMSTADKTNYLLNHQTYFSEWSSVCLIRPILQPNVMLKNFTSGTTKPYFNKGILTVAGQLYFTNSSGDVDTSETETLQTYKVQILTEDGSTVLKQSEAVYTNNSVAPNDINYNMDLQTLDTSESSDFVLRITCVTKNQYTLVADYEFALNAFIDQENFNPTISEKVDNDNGIVTITVTNEKSLPSGSIWIKRLSSEDGFKEPQTIWSGKVVGTFSKVIEDNTVSSLVWYKYSVQFLNSKGAGTQVYYSRIVMPDFYDAILSRAGQQYAIRYNYNISSLKPTVNRTKIDTLGGRYPKFAENAILNYKQLSISGLISAESDAYQKFVEKKAAFLVNETRNYYDTYKLHPHESILPDTSKGDSEFSSVEQDAIKDMVRNDFKEWKKFPDFDPLKDEADLAILEDTASAYLTTTRNDWLWERMFREELVKWLNDGEPKLYRSMAEGSMVVMLSDVSLTPTQNQSRFTYSFSATMYEVEDASSLAVLDELGIYPITQIDLATGESSGGGDTPEPTPYVTVSKPGQTYNLVVSDKNDIRNKILQNLQRKYGKSTDGTDIWDDKNILSGKKPDNIKLKNVRIFFQNAPLLYYFDSYGSPILVSTLSSGQYDSLYKTRPKALGYTFTLVTSESESPQTIFVNERGYYQIPDDIDVKSLSFNNTGYESADGTVSVSPDVVTIEYTLVYDETENTADEITSNVIDKNVIGQSEGVFQPNTWYGDSIRSKYNFINADGSSQYMQYWTGICLDMQPYTMCEIQYKNSTSSNEYLVGGTGVLHFIKNFEVQDIRFLGRRLSIKDKSRQRFLQENECCLDEDVEYASASDVPSPMPNTVYKVNGLEMIYYRDGRWYEFKELLLDSTNVIGNDSSEAVGLAVVPVEGQINYCGAVVQTNYS